MCNYTLRWITHTIQEESLVFIVKEVDCVHCLIVLNDNNYSQ